MSSADGLFSGLFARGEVARAASERAFLQAMLDFEVALMHALARAGLAPAEAAEELQGVADAAQFDLSELGAGTGDKGTPVPALLKALRSRLSDRASAYLHTGATSQDVLDTATMLVARRALDPLSPTSTARPRPAPCSPASTATPSQSGARCSNRRSR